MQQGGTLSRASPLHSPFGGPRSKRLQDLSRRTDDAWTILALKQEVALEEVVVSGNRKRNQQCTDNLGWHVCRAKFAQNTFFDLRNFLRKKVRKFPEMFRPLFGGSEEIPQNSRQISLEFPCVFFLSPTSFCRSSGRAITSSCLTELVDQLVSPISLLVYAFSK